MKYDYKKYQLNSYRHGLITQNKLYGRPSIFFNCETQHNSISKIQKYQKLRNQDYNIICLPLDLTGHESGDNYEIYFYHENVLGTVFHVNEKLTETHLFFKDFGSPSANFCNWYFDDKLNFIKKSTELETGGV